MLHPGRVLLIISKDRAVPTYPTSFDGGVRFNTFQGCCRRFKIVVYMRIIIQVSGNIYYTNNTSQLNKQ